MPSKAALAVIMIPILVFAFADPVPAKSLGHKSAPGTEHKKESKAQCPQRSYQIAKKAVEDVGAYKTRHPSSPWPAFVYETKKKYKSCPSYVKKMYLSAARKAFAGGRQTLLPQR